MQRFFIGLALIATAFLTAIAPAQESPTFSTNRVWRPLKTHPNGGHAVRFTPIGKIRPAKAIRDAAPQFDHTKFKAPTLPIDWAKSIDFPMDGNDQYGDCYYAALSHANNTWWGNSQTPIVFSMGTFATNGTGILNRYRTLSGGDNGLNDSDIQGEGMNRYCADKPDAKFVSWANIDVTNPAAVQTAIANYGCIFFTLAVPNAWINNSDTGAIWDTGTANENNGHAVVFNGVGTDGKYKLQTWGSYVWITPHGVTVCDPAGWVAWSAKWFNAAGYDPSGTHVTTSAANWLAATGKAIPASVVSSFPPIQPTPPTPVPPTPVPPTPVPPTPIPPTPVPPSPGVTTLSISKPLAAGSYEIVPAGTAAKVQELYSLMQPNSSAMKVSPVKNDRLDRLERMMNTQSEAILGLQKAILGPQPVAPVEPKKSTSKVEFRDDPYSSLLNSSRYLIALKSVNRLK